MIHARKLELLSDVNLESVQILKRELDYWMFAVTMLARVSSIIAGLTPALIRLGPQSLLFVVVSTSSAGLLTALTCLCVLLMVFTPEKALRGTCESDVAEATALLSKYAKLGLFILECGVSLFMFAVVLFSLAKFTAGPAALSAIISIVALLALIYHAALYDSMQPRRVVNGERKKCNSSAALRVSRPNLAAMHGDLGVSKTHLTDPHRERSI
ncbi:MAG: uncharacterized protein KVP18_002260 [Porospora cf. gigantea A]|uniref:uncharacterized protein n=1 Tax=Porospora cf. gigantea A TaxID=2853593 RepID=UPI003559D04F|nr:MAG: hypothetical protein KVP18_002260 [Porospora cf. gigantea A]